MTVFDREKTSLQHEIEEKEDMIRQRNGEIQVHVMFSMLIVYSLSYHHILLLAFYEFLGDAILLVEGPKRAGFKRVSLSTSWLKEKIVTEGTTYTKEEFLRDGLFLKKREVGGEAVLKHEWKESDLKTEGK